MPNWTRLSAPAAGAFSATWITRIGAIVFALILGGAFLVQSCFSTVPTDPESILEPEGIAGDRATAQLGARVQDIEQRAALTAAAAERNLAAQGAQLTGGQVSPAFNETTGETLPNGAAGPIVPLTEDEAQLREVLRLEAIERRTRSLRSGPVVITYRRPTGAGRTTSAAATAPAVPGTETPAETGNPTRASTPTPAQAPDFLQSLVALQALDSQLAGESELDTGRALPSGLQIQPPAASPLGATDRARVPQGDPLHPAIVQTPDDPPGWDRIYEGSFLEGVLVNQLNGDFPGPGPRGRGRAVLLGRPAADCDPARRARDRIRVGRRRPGSRTPRRRVSPTHLPRWSMGVPGVCRAESDRRGRTQRPGEPALLRHVRQRRRRRHH